MRILTTITPTFRPLVDRWLRPSLARLGAAGGLTVVVDRTRRSRGSGDFRTPGFDHHVIRKLRLIARWADEQQAPFLVTDADIVYLQPFSEQLADAIAHHDLLLAREYPDRPGFNIGQMVVRPSPQLAEFVAGVAADLSAGAGNRFGEQLPANQDYFNERLAESTLRVAALPDVFANSGIWESMSPARRAEVVSYHATGTLPRPGSTSLEQKFVRLAAVLDEQGIELSEPGRLASLWLRRRSR